MYSVTRNVYQLRPLVYSLGLNNPPRRYFILSKVARQKDMTLQTGILDVKWRELELGLLLSSALKCVPRIVAIRGVPADCHSPDLTACIPCNLSAERERFNKNLVLLW
jgi:hypothetical protein